MKSPVPSSSAPAAHFQCHQGVKLVRDYTLAYSIMDISISNSVQVVFPRTGLLIFSFTTGTDFECRLLNYNRLSSLPFRLHITGLFSESSVFIHQRGVSGGCSMKIHPVIGYYLLKTPMYLLTDCQVQISSVLDREALFLRALEADHQISSFDDPYFHRYLMKILPEKSAYQNDPIYHAVNTIIARKGLIKIKELATQYHMSERTLRRQFLLKVGLSPQAYAKIWQIQHVMDLLNEHADRSLEDIAFEAGFYDAAHLSHDFKNKVLLTPTEFIQKVNPLNQEYLNHASSVC